MNTTSQILPGVKSVAYTFADTIFPAVANRAAAGLPVPILSIIKPITTTGKTKLTCTLNRAFGEVMQEAKLTFNSDTLIEIHENLAFIVETVDGRVMLLGRREPPFPKVKATSNSGSPDSDAAGYQYEITFKAPYALIDVIF